MFKLEFYQTWIIKYYSKTQIKCIILVRKMDFVLQYFQIGIIRFILDLWCIKFQYNFWYVDMISANKNYESEKRFIWLIHPLRWSVFANEPWFKRNISINLILYFKVTLPQMSPEPLPKTIRTTLLYYIFGCVR